MCEKQRPELFRKEYGEEFPRAHVEDNPSTAHQRIPIIDPAAAVAASGDFIQ